MKIFVYIIIAIVAAAVVTGFFVLGTPKEERLRRLDETRVSDLQNLQWQVIEYWRAKDILPDDLSLLVNETSGVRPPVDPETGESYEYNVLSQEDLAFELCANFKTQNQATTSEAAKPTPVYGPYGPEPANWNWRHEVGRACFSRAIDPDLYPPLEKNR